MVSTALLPGVLLVFPAFVGILILSEDLLRILFGPEFTVASIALIILSGEKIFQVIHSLFGNVLKGIDRPDLVAHSVIAATIINLVLNIILVWKFGIVGAAVATTVASFVMMVFQIYYVREFLKISFPFYEAGWSIISSIIMGGIIYSITISYEINSMMDLILIVAFGGGIYAGVSLIYPPIRVTTRDILQTVTA
jgi:O-antigen/teichoic acid export membrane protein